MKQSSNETMKHYLPATLWLLFITSMSLVPKLQLPKFDLLSTDKVGHLGAYALLVWLVLYGFKKAKGRRATVQESAFIFGAAVLYGALIEVIQGNFIPGRVFGYDDMIANAAGAAAAWALAGFPRKTPTAHNS